MDEEHGDEKEADEAVGRGPAKGSKRGGWSVFPIEIRLSGSELSGVAGNGRFLWKSCRLVVIMYRNRI